MNSLLGRNLRDKLFSKLHFGLKLLLPFVVFLLVVVFNLAVLAFILVGLSKWRILTKHPKQWWLNLKLNAVDLIVGGSIVYFMNWPEIALWQQLIWLAGYLVWVLYLKAIKKHYGHLVQGLIAQALGVSVISYNLYQIDVVWMILAVWFISLFAIYHIIHGIKETPYHIYMVYVWSIFSAQLAWVLFHWQINFWLIPRLVFIQIAILLPTMILYIKHTQNTLQPALIRQVLVAVALLVWVALMISSFQSVS